ncbi:MAG: hypothetical protein D6781_07715, partial [Verrucomicrobia bacterium]
MMHLCRNLLRHRRLPILIFAGLLASLLPASGWEGTWPPETDIPVDPAVVSGQLENGLRYAILRNTEPR